jgi:hypothetical protein
MKEALGENLMRYLARITLAAVLCAGTANAHPVLSNLPGKYSISGSSLGLGFDRLDRTKGVGITIGAGLDLMFQSMQAIIRNEGDSSALLTGGIFSDAGGNPGSLLAAFNPIDVASGTLMAAFSLTTSAPFTLVSGVTCWFVLAGPSVPNFLLWNGLISNTAPTASGGVTFAGYRFSSNGGNTWTNSNTFNAVQINAAPVPEPSTWAVVGMGAGLLLIARRRTRKS